MTSQHALHPDYAASSNQIEDYQICLEDSIKKFCNIACNAVCYTERLLHPVCLSRHADASTGSICHYLSTCSVSVPWVVAHADCAICCHCPLNLPMKALHSAMPRQLPMQIVCIDVKHLLNFAHEVPHSLASSICHLLSSGDVVVPQAGPAAQVRTDTALPAPKSSQSHATVCRCCQFLTRELPTISSLLLSPLPSFSSPLPSFSSPLPSFSCMQKMPLCQQVARQDCMCYFPNQNKHCPPSSTEC